jgi:hypothetical protein
MPATFRCATRTIAATVNGCSLAAGKPSMHAGSYRRGIALPWREHLSEVMSVMSVISYLDSSSFAHGLFDLAIAGYNIEVLGPADRSQSRSWAA